MKLTCLGLLLFGKLSSARILFDDCFRTDKWDRQDEVEKDFCGREGEIVDDDDMMCRTWWLPPIDIWEGFIQASCACAVCAAATAASGPGAGVGCTTCGSTALKNWFSDYADAFGGVLVDMADDVMDLAGRWLEDIWEDLLTGEFEAFENIDDWRLEARADHFQWSSDYCGDHWYCVCTPSTSLQFQAMIQLKVYKVGSGGGGGGGDGTPRNIFISNSCEDPIRVAVHYHDAAARDWETSCWYEFEPGEGAFAASGNDRLVTHNLLAYLFAETPAGWGRKVWEGNDHVASCRGRELGMFEFDYIDEDGNISIDFTCEGPDNGSDGYRIEFENTCDEPITFAVAYVDDNNNNELTVLCWYHIDAGERTYLMSDNEYLVTPLDHFWAHGVSQSGDWSWTGDYPETCDGQEIYMMLPYTTINNNGDLHAEFWCGQGGRGLLNALEAQETHSHWQVFPTRSGLNAVNPKLNHHGDKLKVKPLYRNDHASVKNPSCESSQESSGSSSNDHPISLHHMVRGRVDKNGEVVIDVQGQEDLRSGD